MIKGKDGTVIPKVVIERLPRYYRYFDWLENQMEKISSKKLGELMGSSASQVRLDLSYFGDFGQQGYGYNIKKLKQELANILNINCETRFIIVGAGNIGRALTKYKSFAQAGFKLMALFDIKPAMIGEKIDGVKIHDMKDVSSYIIVFKLCIAGQDKVCKQTVIFHPWVMCEEELYLGSSKGLNQPVSFIPACYPAW